MSTTQLPPPPPSSRLSSTRNSTLSVPENDFASVPITSPSLVEILQTKKSDSSFGFDDFFSESITAKRRSLRLKSAPRAAAAAAAVERASLTDSAGEQNSREKDTASHEQRQKALAVQQQVSNEPAADACSRTDENVLAPRMITTHGHSLCSTNELDADNQYESPNILQKDDQVEEPFENCVSSDDSTYSSCDKEVRATAIGITDSTQQEEEGFGDFEGNDQLQQQQQQHDVSDEFGAFEGNTDSDNESVLIADTLERWQATLAQFCPRLEENVLQNCQKSIRSLVLEEAHESLHSRLTWTLVTRAMDDDTGVPKVKWTKSKTEQMYLDALQCKRGEGPMPTALEIIPSDEKLWIDDDDERLSSVYPQQRQDDNSASSSAMRSAPVKSPKSNRFSFSSLSRYLPRLSTSSLPRSDSSAPPSTSSPQQAGFDASDDAPFSVADSERAAEHSVISQQIAAAAYPASHTGGDYARKSDVAASVPGSPLHSMKEAVTAETRRQGRDIFNNNNKDGIIPKRRQTVAAIDTMKANNYTQAASILDLDDDVVTVSSNPSAVMRAYQASMMTPLTPTPTRKQFSLQTEEKYQGDLVPSDRDVLFSRQDEHISAAAALNDDTTIGPEEDDDADEFGDFTEAVKDDGDEFMGSPENWQYTESETPSNAKDADSDTEEWGDWTMADNI